MGELQVGIFLCIPLMVMWPGLTEQVSFNRGLTGLHFNPYIGADGLASQQAKYYTTANVRTMLEVISTKFSKVITSTVDADALDDAVPYQRNTTYYHGAYVRARIAEMAAYINKKRNNLSLTVTVGLYEFLESKTFDKELDLALEASQIAQTIFPGTVEQLVIWRNAHSFADVKTANKLFSYIKTLRERSSNLGLRVGIKQNNCEESLAESVLQADSDEKWTLKRNILINSDFIICEISPTYSVSVNKGALFAFQSIQSQILAQRNTIKSIDKNINVMWTTGWIDLTFQRLRYNTTKYIRDLRDYWALANDFATQHNYGVWISDGIGKRGWWKLRRQDLINNASGYVEYVSDLPVVEGKNLIPNDATRTQQDNFTTEYYATEKSLNVSKTYKDLKTFKQNITGLPESTTANKYNDRWSWKFVATIIGACFLLAIVLIGLGTLGCRKQNLSRYHVLTRQEIQDFRHGIIHNDYSETGDENVVHATALKQPYDSLLEKRKEQFEILTNQPLGGGEFGGVSKAFLRNESDIATEVALKMTKPNAGATAVKGFLSEIKILTYLGNHPNIVPILGAYTAEMYKGTVYIATELCPLGSLRNCLKNYLGNINDGNGSSVPMNDMIRWSYEIACGMEYLGEKGVIHADLATRNVLLSAESTAKITDFGLSRRMYEYTNYTKTSQEPLPWRWMAYESLKMMEFSPKSDVWSYGVTLWEIFSLGAQPYPGLTWTIDFVETLEDGCRLKKPKHATSEIFEIMEKCWRLGTDARPSFTELKSSMRDVQIKSIEGCYTTLSVCPVESNAEPKTAIASSSIAI